MPTSLPSQHASSDMDLDTASACSPALDNLALAADSADMQLDSLQAAALSQAVQHVSHQQQSQQPQQQQREGIPWNSHAALQPLQEVHQAAGAHSYTAERVTPQLQSPSMMSSQGQSQGHGRSHGTTQAPSGPQGMMQGHAGQSPRHGHHEEDEQREAVTLQHASSTSAMMSLAQQAAQSSWNSHQQTVKRHSRHTG